jgi:hypothetical protein
MGPQDPKDTTRGTARDLSTLAGEFASIKGDANHWLTDLVYDALKHRLEHAHGAVEAARIEARRRVGIDERR